MAESGFVERVNRQYFDGGLSPGFLEGLATLPLDREDVKEFIERMFRFMQRADLTARDLSALQGVILGSLLARILPGAWRGRVPPITVKGRHQKIDALIRLQRPDGAGTMLDLGCGFPPATTIDSADNLPGWTIHGFDPSMPAFLAEDREGAYATFDAAGTMVYCQPAAPTLENWNELLADPAETERRFRRILGDRITADPGVYENDEGRAVVDPKSRFERPGLTFGVGGIGQVELADLDVVRCFNVMYYFDAAYRAKALAWFASILAEEGILMVGGDWAFTTECRYFLYRKQNGQLREEEFAFSLDNVVPLGLVPFFALHERDRGLTMLARLVRTLRRDDAFRHRYYDVVDGLRAENGICARGADGHYGSVDAELPPDVLWGRAARIVEELTGELADQAVAVLDRSGWEAQLNEIGMVTVALPGPLATI